MQRVNGAARAGAILVVALVGLAGWAAPAYCLDLPVSATSTSEPGASWVMTGSLGVPRAGHSATLLQDGRVLVVSGSSAELYDPATGAWSATNGPNVGRDPYHTATLLPDGKVLVAGGITFGASADTAELYDPATGTWSFTPLSPPLALGAQTATLLRNGKVLFAGGIWGENRAELYDPATGTWSITGNLHDYRFGHAATLLADGRVLVTGGFVDDIDNSTFPVPTTELYDPVTGTWATSGDLKTAVGLHTATLLPSGKVLVSGGCAFFANSQTLNFVVGDAQLYDPVAGEWTLAASLNHPRCAHTATLLPTGKVLVAGGESGPRNAVRDSAELYDEGTGTWADTASLNVARSEHTATLLTNGDVLLAGGLGLDGEPLRTAERYTTLPAPFAIGAGITGAWYDPAQRGHGLFVEVLADGRFYASWFAFNPGGTAKASGLKVGLRGCGRARRRARS